MDEQAGAHADHGAKDVSELAPEGFVDGFDGEGGEEAGDVHDERDDGQGAGHHVERLVQVESDEDLGEVDEQSGAHVVEGHLIHVQVAEQLLEVRAKPGAAHVLEPRVAGVVLLDEHVEQNGAHGAEGHDAQNDVLELLRVGVVDFVAVVAPDVEDQPGDHVHQHVGHDSEGVADGGQAGSVVLVGADFRDEGEVGDLDGRPSELEDNDEHGVVEQAAPFGGVAALDARRENEREGEDHANCPDQVPGFPLAIPANQFNYSGFTHFLLG